MGTEKQQSFTVLLDRTVPDVRFTSWCPTMDLLALVTADGQLHVHRLNWQRLWWTAPEAEITALAWRPDGKQIAIGTDDGTIMLLNTEDGEIKSQKQIFNAPSTNNNGTTNTFNPASVTALCWVADASPDNANNTTRPPLQDRVQRMFQPPSNDPLPSPVAQGMGYSKLNSYDTHHNTRSWPALPQKLTVLACASAGGLLHFCASALFPLADLNLQQHLRVSDILINDIDNDDKTADDDEEGVVYDKPVLTVKKISIDSHLQEAALLWEIPGEGEDRLLMTTLDISEIGKQASKLLWLSNNAKEVAVALDTCAKFLEEATKEWQDGRKAFNKPFLELDALLRQHNIDSNAQSDLTLLVTMGEYSAAMEQLLSSTMGEAGLRQVARTIDSAVCTVHNIIVEKVQPAVEMLAFRLGEIRGMIAAGAYQSGSLGQLGLSVTELGDLERQAHHLFVQLEGFRSNLVNVGALYRTFLSWLLTATRRLPDDTVDTLMGYPLSHVDRVQDFLLTEFPRDSILPWLNSDLSEDFNFTEVALAQPLPPQGHTTMATTNAVLHPNNQQRQAGEDTNERADSPPPQEDSKVYKTKPLYDDNGPVPPPPHMQKPEDVSQLEDEDILHLQWILKTLDGSLSHMHKIETREVPLKVTKHRHDLTDGVMLLTESIQHPRGLFHRTARALAPTIRVLRTWPMGPKSTVIAMQYATTTTTHQEEAQPQPMLHISIGWIFMDLPSVICFKPQGVSLPAAQIQLPANATVIDVAYYKHDAVALLVNLEDGCRLILVSQDRLTYVESAEEAGTDTNLPRLLPDGMHPIQVGTGVEESEEEGGVVRERALGYNQAKIPLAVSGTRGVGCVLIDQAMRLLLLDLEEDEAPEEEDDDVMEEAAE